jgi:hypothetical protein
MPVKQRIARPRRQQFAPDIIAAFARLERVPSRERCTRAFMNDVRDLHRKLDLVDEFWSMTLVTDASGIAPSRHLAAFEMWVKVQEIRKQLRTAVDAARQ